MFYTFTLNHNCAMDGCTNAFVIWFIETLYFLPPTLVVYITQLGDDPDQTNQSPESKVDSYILGIPNCSVLFCYSWLDFI